MHSFGSAVRTKVSQAVGINDGIDICGERLETRLKTVIFFQN